MRFILGCLIVILFISCQNTSVKNEYNRFYDTTITLVNYESVSFAKLRLKIPERFDTFYQWWRTSDCLPCGYIQYRFADKKYSQFAESGMYWTTIPDSLYQITIRHRPVALTYDSVILQPLPLKGPVYLSTMLSGFTFGRMDSIKVFRKNYFTINSRNVQVIEFSTNAGYLTNTPTLYVAATTNLKYVQLEIIAETTAKDTSGFINNIYSVIKSISITENP